MNFYDMVVSRGARLVAPMLGPLGAPLLGVEPVEVMGARQVQLRALQALQESFSPDIVFPLMDLTTELDAALEVLGDDFVVTGMSPRDVGERLDQLGDVLDIDPEEHPTMLFQLSLAADMREAFDLPIAAFASGPFHLAGQLFGAEEMLLWTASGEDCSVGVMDFVTRLLGGYVSALAQQVDMVMLVEPGMSMISSSYFGKICHVFFQGLSGIIRSAGATPALHLCGDARHLLDQLMSLGIECVSFDSVVDLTVAAKELPLNLILMGNLDVKRLEVSSPADVADKVRRLLREMSGYRNFILSTGCEVTRHTPLENVRAFFDAARG